MPNNIKSSDPKPLGFAQNTRRATDQTSGITYNYSTTTYSSSSVLYGGADNVWGEFPENLGIDNIYPKIKGVVSL